MQENELKAKRLRNRLCKLLKDKKVYSDKLKESNRKAHLFDALVLAVVVLTIFAIKLNLITFSSVVCVVAISYLITDINIAFDRGGTFEGIIKKTDDDIYNVLDALSVCTELTDAERALLNSYYLDSRTS